MKTLSPHFAKDIFRRIWENAFVLGLFSLAWLILRTGAKPSRAIYPCQKVAATNSSIWLGTYLLPFLSALPRRMTSSFGTKSVAVTLLIVVIAGFSATPLCYQTWGQPQGKIVSLALEAEAASSQPIPDIFIVNGTSGNDGGVKKLIDLMGDHGLLFYRSPNKETNAGPEGLIAEDDFIIIKVNCQWDERGGTNTDLLRALIQAIVDHPDGFSGEIVVADNGQGRGSLNWDRSNAEDRSQSAQKVVDSFASSYRVSTYLWDRIAEKKVDEYRDGDMEDGYVVSNTAEANTGLRLSYPKFKTSFGTHVSFKSGIWNQQKRDYDSSRLKVINVPVLKTHSRYGVTACVKHYMGVVSQSLTNAHDTVGRGGMGREMVETRFPMLNILDAIWVNAVPMRGPGTTYGAATRVNVIAASLDPVALDYWSSKHILLQVARISGHTNLSSMDPDNTTPGYFGDWLRLSMEEMRKAGYDVTVDENKMNVYTVESQTQNAGGIVPTSTPWYQDNLIQLILLSIRLDRFTSRIEICPQAKDTWSCPTVRQLRKTFPVSRIDS